jgi:Xaa-Pro aminopeptidase
LRVTDLGAKRARLGEVIDRHALRGAIMVSQRSFSYFAGVYISTQATLPDRLEFYLQLGADDPELLVCDLEASMVREQTDIGHVSEYVEFAETPIGALVEILGQRGITSGRIGVELDRLSAASHLALCAALPAVEFVGVDEDVDRLQAVKTDREIEQLAHAARTTLDAVLSAVSQARLGDSELHLCAAVVTRLMERGGVPEFLVFGANSRALGGHIEPLDRALQNGDLWRIDLGARFFDVINSDLARTGIVGEPSARQDEVMLGLRAAQDAGFRMLEPGRPAREVYHAVRRELERLRLPFDMPHVGHGLGIGVHEAPMIEPASDVRLEAGMVINLEPAVSLVDVGECYHTEDLAVVTADGHELLTVPQQELIRIGG